MVDDFLLSVTHSEWVRGLLSLKGCVSSAGFKGNTSPALVITRCMNTSHGTLIEREELIGSAASLSRCLCVCVCVCIYVHLCFQVSDQYYGRDVCRIWPHCVPVCAHRYSMETLLSPLCIVDQVWIFYSRWTVTGVCERLPPPCTSWPILAVVASLEQDKWVSKHAFTKIDIFVLLI